MTRLQELNMTHFDCWASPLRGDRHSDWSWHRREPATGPERDSAKFFNLPELMNLFKEVADIKTADQLHLPTPEVEYHNVVAQPTEYQQEMVRLSFRARIAGTQRYR